MPRGFIVERTILESSIIHMNTSSKLLLVASVLAACLSFASGTSYFVAGGLGQYDRTGRYEATSHVCNGHPVYQRVSDGADGRYALFDAGSGRWMIGTADRATTCQNTGWMDSNTLSCATPDDHVCPGGWKEYNDPDGSGGADGE